MRSWLIGVALLSACGGSSPTSKALDPDTAAVVSVDRFSDTAGHLLKRSANPMLPAANAAIDFDSGEPFMTPGLGPDGSDVTYYNFDVQSTTPAPIYVFFEDGASAPVSGQLNVVDVIPGDPGYNDFWQVVKVTVPKGYVANTLTSLDEVTASGYPQQRTDMLVNCPVVPAGSTASMRYDASESSALSRGWYKSQVVSYFSFEEAMLTTTSVSAVPLSPIYVSFNVNPDPNNAQSGPPSGFMTDPSTMRTHNVVATLPSDAGYSPLWTVDIYDNSAFASVTDLSTAMAAPQLASGAANVNCPLVAHP